MPAAAQLSPADILDQLQRKVQTNGSNLDQYLPSGQTQTQPLQSSPRPTTAAQRPQQSQRLIIPEDITPLEKDYSDRAGSIVRQFGYDTLRNGGAMPDPSTLAGAVADDYILGAGDEVVLTLRGQKNVAYRARIDREGRAVFPDLPPVSAAGRRFGEFREDLTRQISSTFLQTESFLSLGSVRQINVLVGGEVGQPGYQQMSGLASVLDVLAAAGGIQKTGSLRQIQLVRDGRSRQIDLYPVLVGGRASADLALRDGDRIVVPTLGPTIAVAGEVLRPGIYEIGGKSIDQAQALNLAGGALRPEGYDHLLLSPDAKGRIEVQQLSPGGHAKIAAGDILSLSKTADMQAGFYKIDGHVAVPGVRALDSTPTVGSIMRNSQIFKDDPYLLFAVVQTHDPQSLAERFIPLNPMAIQAHAAPDYRLVERDTVIFLSGNDIRYLFSADVQNVLNGLPPSYGRMEKNPPPSLSQTQPQPQSQAPGQAPSQPQSAPWTATAGYGTPRYGSASTDSGIDPAAAGAVKTAAKADSGKPDFTNPGDIMATCAGLRSLSRLMTQGGSNRFLAARQFATATNVLPDVQPCPSVYDRYPALLPYLLDNVVSLQSEVQVPGIYPVVADTLLDTVVSAAGGYTRAADLGAIEVMDFGGGNGGLAAGGTQIVNAAAAAHSTRVGPGMVLRVQPKVTDREMGPVVLRGEVRRPGTYSIRRGETLSQLVARAGGITEQAYPLGAVFTRESVKADEQSGYEEMARDLESTMATALTNAALASSDTSKEQALATKAIQDVIRTLRSAKATGRVVVEADPTILQVRPEQDTVLEPGDMLYVPKRPSHVSVTGEVLHGGAQQFISGAPADEYIKMAGGLKSSADESRIFVILPSGRAQPLSVSFWNYQEAHIPPGSTIVVPRDPSPFNFWGFTKDITQVLSQVAISAASLAVISR